MKEYVRTIDGLPLIVRLILAFPVFDGIVYGIYRIAKGRLIVGILWIVLGVPFLLDHRFNHDSAFTVR
ncbi:MAG: hypothetical protein MZU97_21295 [Bacillus subtilis]|nr:hypothetical protein [Bacillus subtilis]